jgi:hypothetical protein
VLIIILVLAIGAGLWHYKMLTNAHFRLSSDISTISVMASERDVSLESTSSPLVQSFSSTSTFFEIGNSYYFRHDNSIYIRDRSGSFTLFSGADPNTFQVLGLCVAVEMDGAMYTKDQFNVWCGMDKIQNADPATFQFVGDYDDNPGGMPSEAGIAKEKNCIYHDGSPILDQQGSCSSPSGCTVQTMTSTCEINESYARSFY